MKWQVFSAPAGESPGINTLFAAGNAWLKKRNAMADGFFHSMRLTLFLQASRPGTYGDNDVSRTGFMDLPDAVNPYA
ncbi:MAG: hypothetical protein DSY89_01115 [Deltaproteobacteria bacterium]|nr:MAG: hypothetical protein DSY89_01115 [Deltaproteobacteria bacterium]